MTEYTIVVFGARHVAVEPALRAANVRAWVLHQVPFSPPSGGLTFLAIGPEGGAELARWVDAHGLDGVTGIGLVGVTAPWAKRGACYGEWVGGSGGHKRWKRCGAPTEYVSSFDADDADPEPLCQEHFDSLHPKSRVMWKPARVLLGPLEPLRAVAERARHGDECTTDGCGAVHQECPVYCDECDIGRTFALKFVVACAPDDGVCSTCDGTGRVPCNASNCIGADHECDVCDGTGKALSSAQVASELVGVDVGSTTDSMASGGTWVDVYSSNVALADHGLRSVIENLNR